MKARELNEMLKIKTPNQILTKHMLGEVFLTNAQLDKVIKLKKGTNEEGHGGCNSKKLSDYKC
jgi:hypothetical protein